MGRKKLQHFAEMKTWAHVFEPQPEWGNPAVMEFEPTGAKDTLEVVSLGEDSPEKDFESWRKRWGARVILELGCGGGEYTLELAARTPDCTVIGVDIKGARLWRGARAALESGLQNVRFLRIRIESLLRYFHANSVDEIWITFPNPHPNEGKERKRLTSPRFLDMYAQILKPGGFLHLKTDFGPLFVYTVDTLKTHGALQFDLEQADADVYSVSRPNDVVQAVQTFFERQYLKQGKTIKYVRARKKA